jgi:predicted alpha/beta hydrolase family esterase
MKFVILHGSFAKADESWRPELKYKLELLHQEVLNPQFPVENWDEITELGEDDAQATNQNIKNWLDFFKKEIYPKIKNEEVVFITHSLGPVFLLHLIENFNLSIDAAIFVSPFLDLRTSPEQIWQINLVNKSFLRHKFNFKKIKKSIKNSFVLYSENDPYVPAETSIKFAEKLDAAKIPVFGAKHMNDEVHLDDFPLVLELCKSRIDLTLYQKYLDYIGDFHQAHIIRNAKNSVITLPITEVEREGIYHFKHLKKDGFATVLVADILNWQKNKGYYEAGRTVAKKVDITRVIFIDKKEDLENEIIKEFVALEKGAGIKIYACLHEYVKSEIENLDFGIWDDSYVCIIDHKHNNFSTDSRSEKIKKANQDKQIILQKAFEL